MPDEAPRGYVLGVTGKLGGWEVSQLSPDAPNQYSSPFDSSRRVTSYEAAERAVDLFPRLAPQSVWGLKTACSSDTRLLDGAAR